MRIPTAENKFLPVKTCWFIMCRVALLLLIPVLTFAQRKDLPMDTIRAKLGYNGSIKPASVLFAHFDKTIYNNTETAWFTAYLLNNDSKANNPTILSAMLVREADKSVILTEKFALKNGSAYGNIDNPG